MRFLMENWFVVLIAVLLLGAIADRLGDLRLIADRLSEVNLSLNAILRILAAQRSSSLEREPGEFSQLFEQFFKQERQEKDAGEKQL